MQFGTLWVITSENMGDVRNEIRNTSTVDQSIVSCSSVLRTKFPKSVNLTLSILTLIWGTGTMVSCIGVIITIHLINCKQSWIQTFPTRKKQMVGYYRFYLIMSLISSIGLVILSSMVIARYCGIGPVPQSPVHICLTLTMVSQVWSMMSFMQTTDHFGYYVIIVQRMIMDLLSFLLIFVLLWFPFLGPFTTIIQSVPDQGCQAGFESIHEIGYSLIKALFHSINFDEFIITDKLGLIVTHVLYMLICSMLLINLIIAIFSDSVANIVQHKDVFTVIQKICLVSQTSLPSPSSLISNYLWGNTKKYFRVENDKVYLICVKNILK